MKQYRWYQTIEPLFDEELVSDCGDGIEVKRCNMVDEIPLGRVKKQYYQNTIISGDRVLIDPIWYFGRLVENITIGDVLFTLGTPYKYMKTIVEGGDLDDYMAKMLRQTEIDKRICELERKKRELWK